MTSFRPNRAGFDAMAVGPEVRGILKAKADEAKGIAQGLAQDFRVTGDYADSFEVTDETEEFAGHSRAAAVLTNHSPHAAAVEWGNEDVTVYLDEATQKFVSAAHADDPGVKRLSVSYPKHRVLGKTLDGMSG